MVAADLSRYLDEKDKNGSRVGDWASSPSSGIFVCKFCTPQKPLSFKAGGKYDLFKHSESAKHIKNVPKVSNQASIKDMFEKTTVDSEIDEKVLDFEAAFVMVGSSHGIPTAVMDCLTETLKKYITDSEIVKKIKLHTTGQ